MCCPPAVRLFRALVAVFCWGAVARAAELDLPPTGAFTIVVIPDTQGYLGRETKATPSSTAPLTNPVFENHTRWIVENLRRQNIVFVTHVGDIVDIDNRQQWQLARKCLDRLHGVVPYGLTVGNHVRALLSDYTSSGPLRLYRFIPVENQVRVITYDTSKRELVETARYVNDRNAHQFTLDYLMTPVGVSSR